MRLWHQKMIPHLPRQQLLGQHRECCALRGKGWGKKHATVDYAFKYDPAYLVAYHCLVMDEMIKRGYNPDKTWYKKQWRGSALGETESWCDEELCRRIYDNASEGSTIYPEHSDAYLQECLENLKGKGIDLYEAVD